MEIAMPPPRKAAAPAKKAVSPAKQAAAPPKKTASAKPAPQATFTMKQIAAELAERMLSDLVTVATRHLKKGDKIRLTGLGIPQVRARPARMGRNPATGEAIKIKASKKIAFRPAKELKETV
jgi:DNA-binding protein HU-beta